MSKILWSPQSSICYSECSWIWTGQIGSSKSNWESALFSLGHTGSCSAEMDGKFCICGDNKITINPVLNTEQHPLPKPRNYSQNFLVAQNLWNVTCHWPTIRFCWMTIGYALVTTHRCLYKFNRITYGLASAPAIFQKLMESVLQGNPNVGIYIDDG